jgi:hypothetical protein
LALTARLDPHSRAQRFRIRADQLEAVVACVEHREAFGAATLEVVRVVELDPSTHCLLAASGRDHREAHGDSHEQ